MQLLFWVLLLSAVSDLENSDMSSLGQTTPALQTLRMEAEASQRGCHRQGEELKSRQTED